MQDKIPTCGICFQEYNSKDRVARIIPICGHSLCTKRITDILSKNYTLRCPFDKKPFNQSLRTIDSFFINYALQNLVEEEDKDAFCEEHKDLKKKLICAKDKQMVCEECVYDGKHTGHKIYPLKKVKGIAQQKLEKCNASLKQIGEWNAKFNKVFDQEQIYLKNVSNIFSDLKAILTKKQAEIVEKIKAFFGSERKEMESSIGVESSVMKSIKQATNNLQEVINGKNVLKVFSNTSENIPAFNDCIFEKLLQELNQKLQEIKESFKKPVAPIKQLITSMNVSINSNSFSQSEQNSLNRSASLAILKTETSGLNQPRENGTHPNIFQIVKTLTGKNEKNK